jgi:hypothetical protein
MHRSGVFLPPTSANASAMTGVFKLILGEPDYQRGRGYEGIRFFNSDPGAAVFFSLSAVFRRSRKIFSFEGSTPSSTGLVG